MRKKISIVILMALIMASACKKSEDAPKPDSSPRIKSVYVSLFNITSNYFYNPDGRISMIARQDGARDTFEYYQNRIVRISSNASGTPVVFTEYHLNDSGLCDSIFYAPSSNNWAEAYSFDNNNLPVQLRKYEYGNLKTVTNNTFSNGNKLSAVVNFQGSGSINTAYWDYYFDKPNTIGNENIGLSFLGKSARNLQKQSVFLDNAGDTIGSNHDIYYFDASGRVSGFVEYNKNNQVSDSSSFTYY